jgi:hypothetical protein
MVRQQSFQRGQVAAADRLSQRDRDQIVFSQRYRTVPVPGSGDRSGTGSRGWRRAVKIQ